MRPRSYDFVHVRTLASSLEAFPAEFFKTLLIFFHAQDISKTSANLFTPPITRSRSLRPLKQKVSLSTVLLQVGGLPGRISKNCFFIFLTLRHALKPWLICLLIQRQLCVLQQKIKIAVFPKVPGLISRTVCMHACVYKFHSETQVPLLLFR